MFMGGGGGTLIYMLDSHIIQMKGTIGDAIIVLEYWNAKGVEYVCVNVKKWPMKLLDLVIWFDFSCLPWVN